MKEIYGTSRLAYFRDQLERGEASDEVSAKLNAKHEELQSLLGKRKALFNRPDCIEVLINLALVSPARSALEIF